VPRIFELYNGAIISDDIATALSIYRAERHHIDDCPDCADACGQGIDTPGWLKKAHRLFTG
jgi:predicted aldo/keto reductase-like oxidoreductase